MIPWLSVIMPVHHGAEFLGSALTSVAAEDPEGVEVRIYNSADDGGAARRVAERFADRIHIVWQDRPDLKPWTSKTNLGVNEAQASHIAMLHQDDLWLPGHLAAMGESIARYPEASMTIGPSRFAAADGRLLNTWRLPFQTGLHSGSDVVGPLLVQNTIAIPSPVIRKQAWQDCGGLDDALWYTADWDLYLKLAATGDLVVRPRPTTAFRVHGSSLTMSGRSDLQAFRYQLEMVLDRHLGKLGASPGTIEAHARASIALNCALAAASSGRASQLPGALLTLARLGPAGLARYLAESRIVDRLRPRLQLKLAGAL